MHASVKREVEQLWERKYLVVSLSTSAHLVGRYPDRDLNHRLNPDAKKLHARYRDPKQVAPLRQE